MSAFIKYPFTLIDSNKFTEKGTLILDKRDMRPIQVNSEISFTSGSREGEITYYTSNELFVEVSRPTRRLLEKFIINRKYNITQMVDFIIGYMKKHITSFKITYINRDINLRIPLVEILITSDTFRLLNKNIPLATYQNGSLTYHEGFTEELFLLLFNVDNAVELVERMLFAYNDSSKNNRKYAKTEEVQWAIKENINYAHNDNVVGKDVTTFLANLKIALENISTYFNLSKVGAIPSFQLIKSSAVYGRYEVNPNRISVELNSLDSSISTIYHEMGHFVHMFPYYRKDSPSHSDSLKNTFDTFYKKHKSPQYLIAFRKKLSRHNQKLYNYLNDDAEVFARYFESYMLYITKNPEYAEHKLMETYKNTIDELIPFEELMYELGFLRKKFIVEDAYLKNFANLDAWLNGENFRDTEEGF